MTFKREPRKPSTGWIVVADRAQARLFKGEWPEFEDLTEIEGLIHPESASRMHDIVTDRAGRFQGNNGRRAATDSQTDFAHQTAVDFGRLVVERLEEGRVHNAFGHLVIISPPMFLGVLRERFGGPLAQLVELEIDKEVASESLNEIRDRVRAATQQRAEQ